MGYATARADIPDFKEANLGGFSALVEALTGRGQGCAVWTAEFCGERLEGFMRHAEPADAVARRLGEARRR